MIPFAQNEEAISALQQAKDWILGFCSFVVFCLALAAVVFVLAKAIHAGHGDAILRVATWPARLVVGLARVLIVFGVWVAAWVSSLTHPWEMPGLSLLKALSDLLRLFRAEKLIGVMASFLSIPVGIVLAFADPTRTANLRVWMKRPKQIRLIFQNLRS
jgi:hypothetical protein